MASVFVDIPGIGTVEAKNAASEATLLAILKAMKAQKPGKPGPGGGSSIDNDLEDEKEKQTSSFENLRKNTVKVIGGMSKLGESITGTIKQFANVGDSVESAAQVFNKIPIVGDMFAAVAGAATKVSDSFQAATASGATFGGSIQQFASSASAAGMTMDKFAQLISKNGESLRLLGGDTATGAKRFAAISKTLRTSSNELYNLGYSTEDVNQGMANYTKYLGQTGKIGNQTNAQLASGAKNYLKEMDLLAKVTGTSRKEQEDARAKLLNDAQFQGKVANMSAKAGEAFANTVNMLPPGLQDVAKDIMVTGTATTEESQKFMSMMPKSAALMQKYAAITDAGGTITAEMQNELNNMLAAEGKAAKQQYAVLGKFNKEFGGAFLNTVQASNIQTDAMKNATKEQKEAAEKQATLAAAMEKNKQALSELSNTFQMALANSGILDLMMNAFQFLANLTQTYLIPAFKIMAAIVTSVGGFLLETLKPVFEWLTGFIRETLYPAFLKLATFIIVDIVPVFETLGGMIRDYVWPALQLIGGVIMDYVWPAFKAIGGFIANNLNPILTGLGVALGVVAGLWVVYQGMILYQNLLMAAHNGTLLKTILSMTGLSGVVALVTSPMFLLVAGITAVVFIFKKLGGDLEVLRLGFGMLTEYWKGLFNFIKLGFYQLLDMIPGLDFSEEIKETKEDIKKNAETIVGNAKAINTRMAENRANADKENQEKDKKRAATESKIDEKIIGIKNSSADGLADANKKEKAALEERTNLNTADSVALLGQELKSQKSAILPTAEAAKKEIEQKGVAKQADEASTKESAMKKAVAEQEAAKAASPVKTQESAESLLASLNTKLDHLIAVGKFQIDINQRQLSAAQALSGDLHKMA